MVSRGGRTSYCSATETLLALVAGARVGVVMPSEPTVYPRSSSPLPAEFLIRVRVRVRVTVTVTVRVRALTLTLTLTVTLTLIDAAVPSSCS